MLREGSKSFHAAAQLLPDRMRQPVTVLYAFCRLADDGVDHAADGPRALVRLHQRLDRAYAGDPLDQPVDRAFADLIAAHQLPKTVFEWLFEGFAWDAQGARYDTISDVRAYAIRVAGTVGVMMALLMGTRTPEALARACDLGVAMQLTNIARDVGEDANAGRLYLPRGVMAAEGLDPEAWLARPAMSPALGRVIARVLGEADRLYDRAESGIACLPGDCRLAIYAARYIYAEIGQVLARRQGYDSVSRRAVVPARAKLRLAAQAIGAVLRRPGGLDAPALPEAEPLLAAVAEAPHPDAWPAGFDAQLGWVLTLFERKARRERLGQ